jgi:hypothetical protein
MIVHLDHPNAQHVRRTAIALGGLLHEVVFVGGPMVPFFITDRGLHRLRPTDDIDVIVECRTRHAHHEFAQRLATLGFRPDQSPGAPVSVIERLTVWCSTPCRSTGISSASATGGIHW